MARGGGRLRGGGSGGGRANPEEENVEVQQDEENVEVPEEEAVAEAIPRHVDGRMILDPTGLWFRNQTVVRGVTNSYQENLTRGITCWTEATDEERELWFNAFRRAFYWPEHLERVVWDRYNHIGKKRFRDIMYKASKSRDPPKFMKGKVYEEFTEKRNSPEFKEASARNKVNKRGGKAVDVNAEPSHYGGSQSFYDRAMSKAKKNQGKLPSVVDLFLETHAKESKSGYTFANDKDRALFKQFLVRKKNNPEVSDDQLWYELVEGFQKGEVYGAGAAKELYFEPPPRRGPQSRQQTYQPGMILQLQSQLAARDKRDAKRDEELRKMQEQMDFFNSMFANCNSGWRPQFKDPRDPDNGGGSGASASFPVV